MKRFCTVFFLLALASVAPVYPMEGIVVDVPFEFTIGNRVLGPGEYTILMIGDRLTAQISANDGKETVFVHTFKTLRNSIPEIITQWVPGPISGYGSDKDASGNLSNEPPPKSSNGECALVFNRYGSQYFIARMWVRLEGREFIRSKSERDLLAGNPGLKSETVVLVAR